MRPIAHDGMTHIAHAKIHAQAAHTSGILQIHFEHIGAVSYLTLTDEISKSFYIK